MIDTSTGWFKIIQQKYKKTATIENLVEKMWLCRYQRPKIITYDHRHELPGHMFKKEVMGSKYI